MILTFSTYKLQVAPGPLRFSNQLAWQAGSRSGVTLILQFKSSQVAVRTMFFVANTAVWKNWCTRYLSRILDRCRHNLLVWVKSVLHEHLIMLLQLASGALSMYVCTWFCISPKYIWHHPLFTLSRQTDLIYPRLSWPSPCQSHPLRIKLDTSVDFRMRRDWQFISWRELAVFGGSVKSVPI